MGKATVASELEIVIKPNIKTAVDVKATRDYVHES
jgi:hypothetical protein